MKICMAAMSLNIGGAETHIVELAGGLKKSGHDVTVVSGGGVFVPVLESLGIRHVTLPLDRKDPASLIRNCRGLSALFDAESFDVVHAHARIPAFTVGLVRKKYTFGFVTTCHGMFFVNALWKRVSEWGDRCIAVSEDIKQYLIDNYGCYPDNVTVTINGIDTDRFSPVKSEKALRVRESLGIPEDTKLIVHVSRLYGGKGSMTEVLFDAFDRYLESGADARLVVAGDGEDRERIFEKAGEINARRGENRIMTLGARTDIEDILSAADAFAGVSRAALEAMSSGLPVILAGNEGYLGVFDESKFAAAYAGNFCCRGTSPASPDDLCRDISDVLGWSSEKKAKAGEYNRDVVLGYYSVDKMVRDCERVYEQTPKNAAGADPDVVISGYYGFGNMGDDSFLQIMISLLKKRDKDMRITVLSARPKKTAKIYGVASMNRFNLPGIYSALRKASLLISGGGTLLQNETSTKSLLYYTSIIALAKKAGTRIMIYANGIGPLSGEKAMRIAKRAIDSADTATLREKTSWEYAKNVFGKKDAILSADPAVCLEPCTPERYEMLRRNLGIRDDRKYYAMAIRPIKDGNLCASAAEFCLEMKEKYGLYPIFVPMQESVDMPLAEKLNGMCGKTGCVVHSLTAGELLAILKNTEFCVSMRLHALIYAFAVSKPMIAISYDPKVEAFMDSVDMPYCVKADGFDPRELFGLAEKLMSEKEGLCLRLSEKLGVMRGYALRDAALAAEIEKNEKGNKRRTPAKKKRENISE